MENKKKLTYVIIGFLLLIIILLFLLLFVPVNNEGETYSIQDYINVENNLLEIDNEKIESSLDIDQISSNLDEIGSPDFYNYY